MHKGSSTIALVLLTMPKEAYRTENGLHPVHVQAQHILRDIGLPNSYTLTKHMAEGLVADMHAAGVLPVAIVRPSIIGCIAHKPVPGYFGNSAGLTSAILAFASGGN